MKKINNTFKKQTISNINTSNLNEKINSTLNRNTNREINFDNTLNLNEKINSTINRNVTRETIDQNTSSLNEKINSTINRNVTKELKTEVPDVIVVTSKPIIFPVDGLSWTTTVNNPCNPNPWVITNLNQSIRYNISDSFNCGGTCNSIQSGTATASITAGDYPVRMYVDFYGIGELKDANYELLSISLNGNEIANAHATGGGVSCSFGPITKEFIIEPPYLLDANGVYNLFINFTTNDALHHVGCYYQINLSFEAVVD